MGHKSASTVVVRSNCKECGGASFCEHSRQRSRCKECGGSSICEHGRQRYWCKNCGGGAYCEHGRERRKVQGLRRGINMRARS